MRMFIHKTKKEKLEWLFWFYDGKYSRFAIRKQDYVGWYFKLRYSGARKPSKSLNLPEKESPLHILEFLV